MKRLVLLCACLLLSAQIIATQPGDAAKLATKADNASEKAAKDAEAARILKERRENAQSVLLNLAADAIRFNDQTLRARTQARIADVLWPADPERARTLFRKAWDSAEVVDQESRRKVQEDVKQQQARGGSSVAVVGPSNIRAEVLRLAARRDRALGEELLAKLKVEKDQEATEASDRARTNPFDSPEAVTQRLNLARQLLDSDVERALQFADPVLTTANRSTIDFLSYLREKDPAAADQRYQVLMARAAGDLQADANTVSILSSYIFTPHMFVTFESDGNASTQSTSRNTEPAPVAPELRAAFLRAAGAILLRPLAPAGQDQTTSGIVGKYLMLKRLNPLFDQFAPRELADAVHAQMDALAQAVPENTRNNDDNTVREGIRPPQSSEDREKALQDRIDRARTSAERDALYIQMARLYADNLDLRARDFVEKIDDSDLRDKTRAFIDGSLARRAIDKKDVDKTVEIVRIGTLTHAQKAWALTQAAKFLVKSDRDKATSMTEDASAEARRIEESDPDRPRSLMAVANVVLLLDRAKAWDAVYDAIKAANSADEFTGEDGVVRLVLQTKQVSSIRSSSVADFDVAGIFDELAKDDYNRAIELARGFQREAPRAGATIAIAKSVLEEKKK